MTKKERFNFDNFDNDEEIWELLNIQAEIIFDLEKENKQLKQKINSLKDARCSYKQDWKQASADCEIYKDEIDILKDENEGLIEENEQLKSDLKSYQNMVQQYINLHIDKIRRRYVNPTKEEVAERTRIIRDLEQLKKELQE